MPKADGVWRPSKDERGFWSASRYYKTEADPEHGRNKSGVGRQADCEIRSKEKADAKARCDELNAQK